MTIDGLELLAANLYKQAEEATPIIGGADKKDWMARRLEEIVENGGPRLDELLACDKIDEVLDLLGLEYEDMKHPDDDDVIDDELVETKEVDAPIINPVADSLGIEDTGTVRMEDPDLVESDNKADKNQSEYSDNMQKDAIVTPYNETEMPDDIILVEETVLIIEDEDPTNTGKDEKSDLEEGCKEI